VSKSISDVISATTVRAAYLVNMMLSQGSNIITHFYLTSKHKGSYERTWIKVDQGLDPGSTSLGSSKLETTNQINVSEK